MLGTLFCSCQDPRFLKLEKKDFITGICDCTIFSSTLMCLYLHSKNQGADIQSLIVFPCILYNKMQCTSIYPTSIFE